ncbi:MAG: lysylphosphatidylglycerol synthetase family protein, partial [Gammaproteobacteria bacterium]|nr:lysylphosphatidylglycerol synthetase family protein [Gammaproteobacteria bacterium]
MATAAGLTVASYGILACHDWFGLRYAGQRLPWGQVAFTSFVACVFSYNIGLSGLGGAAVRYRLYTGWGLAALDIGKVILFIMATFWLGMATALGTALTAGVGTTGRLPIGQAGLRWLGAGLLALVIGYLTACAIRKRPVRVRGLVLPLPGSGLALVQVGLGTVDVLLAGTVLFALLPGGDVRFETFLGVYLIVIGAGALSHVPGGLGVFETVFLLTLPTATPRPELVAALVAFRVVYYLLPFCSGLVLVGVHEAARQRERLAGWVHALSKGLGLVTPRVLTFAVFLAGLVLLTSGVTPSEHSRLRWLGRLFPIGVIEVSHFLASVAGVGLLFLARGLQLRLNAAWGVALAVLLAGVLFSLAKGADFEEATALGVAAAALAASRARFHRRSSLWDQRFSPAWITAIALVLIGTTALGLFAYRHVEYSHELWWTFERMADAPRFLRATVGVGTLVLVLGLARLFRPARLEPAPASAAEIETALTIV